MFKLDTDDTTHQVEPVRKTFLNVLLDNLKEAGRMNYVHRLIYIGEHTFPPAKDLNIADAMQTTIEMVNADYNDEFLSGILLYYTKYFCHMIEGSEDSIIKHLLLLTENSQFRSCLGRMKMLVCYHHINQRFLPEWIAITGKPPTLLERLDPASVDIYRTYKHAYSCIRKLYKLAYRRKNENSNIMEIECLPEFGLIEFLLSTQYTTDLYQYINLYGVIPIQDADKELVWPVPTEFIPFHIFDEPIDPVTDLSSAAAQQEATEAAVE